MKNYNEMTKEELLEVVKELNGRKKYGLVWEDKPEDVVEQCKEMLPVLEEVADRAIEKKDDGVTNLLIEGDNYHALSVLNYTHAGKIDVIYIDPPYNTGREKEWKFNDKWVDINDSYRHSKWLSFISKRLELTKHLLKENGVLFISIDDHEYAQLKLLCDNVFGEKQFVGSLVWEKKKKGSHLDGAVTNVKEYILVYTKNVAAFMGLVGEVKESTETYPCINPGNGYSKRLIPAGTKSTFRQSGVSLLKGHTISSGNMKLILCSDLVIQNNRLKKDVIIEAEWRYNQDSIDDFAKKDQIYFTQDLYVRRIVSEPRYKKLKDLLLRTSDTVLEQFQEELIEELKKDEPTKENVGTLLKTIESLKESKHNTEIDPKNLYIDGWGSNEDGDDEQRAFFGKKVFDYPKPSRLIEKLIASTGINEGIVLDFFAGSGTTGHAVAKLVKKGKILQYILCTNNENGIAEEVTYPRIKNVIEGYADVEGIPSNLRYFKTAFVKQTTVSDDTRRELVEKSTEMICVKEGTYTKIYDNKKYKVYKNNDHITGILFDLDSIKEFKEKIGLKNMPANLYIFSLSNDTFYDDFADLDIDHTLCPIPESILEVYRKLFA